MNKEELCDTAISILKDSGWCQKILCNKAGQSCIIGSIGKAIGAVQHNTISDITHYNKISTFLSKNKDIMDAIRNEVKASKAMVDADLISNLIYLNDKKCKSIDDAIGFLERVKAR